MLPWTFFIFSSSSRLGMFSMKGFYLTARRFCKFFLHPCSESSKKGMTWKRFSIASGCVPNPLEKLMEGSCQCQCPNSNHSQRRNSQKTSKTSLIKLTCPTNKYRRMVGKNSLHMIYSSFFKILQENKYISWQFFTAFFWGW